MEYLKTREVYFSNKKYNYVITLNGSLIKVDKQTGMNIENNSVISKDKNNFEYFELYKDGITLERFFIDELVASYWLKKPYFKDYYVLHKNGDINNNNYLNLEYIPLEDAIEQNLPMRTRLKQKKEYIKKPTTFIQTKIIENDIEEWKACDKDFEISNFGNIRKSDTKEIINDFYLCKDRPFINVGKKRLFIHNCVVNQFIKPDFNNYIISHIDKDKTNNYYKNIIVENAYEKYKERIIENVKKFREKKKLNKPVKDEIIENKIIELDNGKTQKQALTRQEINRRYYLKNKLKN